MAVEGDKIEYKDLISPDNSINELISQLEQLNKSYGVMINAVRAGAERIVHSMKQVSGATSEGRAKIDEATGSASRLKKAQDKLAFALTETGREVARLKAQTSDTNKVTVEQQRTAKMLVGSYDALQQELKENIQLWKSLSEAEREDAAMGGQVLNTITSLNGRLVELNAQIKPVIESMTRLQKAEQELAYLQSEEGQQLMKVNAQIRELKAEYSGQKTEVDALTKAKQDLAKAQSDENVEIQRLKQQTEEANRVAKLEAQLANSKEGSYDRLSAQYQLNKIELNKMSKEMRNTTAEGQRLEKETQELYKQMVLLQEATGNHRLSVGNYAKAWNGLGMSVNQIIRELPSAAMGFNTFILAISNNVPILIDEIQKVKEANKIALAQGKPTQNILKTITASILSWQTALIIGITVLSMHGDKIIEWCKKLVKGPGYVISNKEAVENLNEELEKTNDNFGANVVSLKRLSSEWKTLKTVQEKNQFIKDNASEFRKLDVAVTNATQAENVFVANTSTVIKALMLRAKAAAARKLAEKEYEKMLKKQNEADLEREQGISSWDRIQSAMSGAANATPGSGGGGMGTPYSSYESAETIFNRRISNLESEAKAAETVGDNYFKIAEAYELEARAKLKSVNIDEYHKKDKGGKREPRDLTDTIYRNQISLQRSYEKSVTELQADEYVKRRKAAADQVQDENNKLREMYRKNEEYVKNVGGKYKALTEDQKKQISQQQEWITKTLANNLQFLDKQLQQIENEQKIRGIRNIRESTGDLGTLDKDATTVTTGYSVSRDRSQIESSLVEERKLLEQNLDIEYAMILNTNKQLREAGDIHARSEEEILIELNRKKLSLYAEYDNKILSIREQNIEDRLSIVKKGSQEELDLLLQQNEIRRQLALAENASKPADQQVDTSVINAKFDKSAKTTKGNAELTKFNEAQSTAEAEFNAKRQSQYAITLFTLQQEKERWEKQIELAKSGALEWSDEQIAAAEATVNGINRQIDEASSFAGLVGDKGLGGALLTKLGFDDKQIAALEEAANVVIENLNAIFEAEVELAEKEVELAQQRVEAAQSVYDAEIEARNNGYANNVATAKKELQQEKKNQKEKEKILADAQKRQQAIDTITQTSSLITASANIWAAFSKTGPWGTALAIAAIATMFGSFAAAKIKAAQVARQSSSQEYGEGGLEFLTGGSHASGNDIDLATKNSKGKNMRAEGGEAMAIINKRSTRKYRKHLPGIIDSLNKGMFEEKYLKAFEAGEKIQNQFNTHSVNIDLAKLEHDVSEIKKQNGTRYYNLGDGTTIVIKGNVVRHIKN